MKTNDLQRPEERSRRFLGGYADAQRFLLERGVPVTEQSLRRLVSQKRVPFSKPMKRVLFDAEALERWLDEHTFTPAARGGSK